MFYPRYYFTLLPRILSSALLPALVVSVFCVSSLAQRLVNLERKVESGAGAAEEEVKALGKMGWMLAPPKEVIKARADGGDERPAEKARTDGGDERPAEKAQKDGGDERPAEKARTDGGDERPAKKARTDGGPERPVEIESEEQDRQGNVIVAIGNVHLFDGDILIIADRVTYNEATSDALAEGNVYFVDQGQRLTGEVLEFNYKTRRGVMRNPTAFTNTTPDGTMVVIDAKRADKTGEDTYNLENAVLTTCQEKTPKWAFTAKRARIRLDHRAKVYNAFLRVKGIPVLWVPYASISISKKDRSSGFLMPSSGSSSIKGRTFHQAYFQTLGRSADVLVRADVFSQRGVGVGFDFRARPDENSRIAFGSFLVVDRVLGPKFDPACDRATLGDRCKLPNQGGSSFYADAVQYFKNGFVAVADVNVTSSPAFRQVFSDNVLNAISPEERSVFYLNKNWRSYSFNAQVGEQSVFVANSSVKTRQLPSIELSRRSEKVSDKFPVYFSFGAALDGVQRIEKTGEQVDLKTPSIIQRLDLSPRLTFPLKSFAGFTLTPSVGVRSTFYSDSLDPVDPVKRQFVGQNLLRNYADLDLDLRAPSLGRVFRHKDGTSWFKHVIEPFVEYRRIKGIDDFGRTPLIDERDMIAETNEVEYGVTNRFFVKRQTGDGSAPQTHELLNLTVSQKYFFDPTFGGALREGQRNQFFPLNTLSGFAIAGAERDVSPLNLKARLYPTTLLYADLRLNYDTRFHNLRDLIAGMGVTKGIFSLGQTWYYTRRIEDDKLRRIEVDKLREDDPTTFPGNQFDFWASVGNRARGPYTAFSLSYDFRDQLFNGQPKDPRFISLSTTSGWAWNCCGVEIQHVTFNAGNRNESRFVFAFTLKGIGTFGTQTLTQFMGQMGGQQR